MWFWCLSAPIIRSLRRKLRSFFILTDTKLRGLRAERKIPETVQQEMQILMHRLFPRGFFWANRTGETGTRRGRRGVRQAMPERKGLRKISARNTLPPTRRSLWCRKRYRGETAISRFKARRSRLTMSPQRRWKAVWGRDRQGRGFPSTRFFIPIMKCWTNRESAFTGRFMRTQTL